MVAFGVLAFLARAAAVGSKGPWFSPALSLQVYGATLFLASGLALVLAVLASSRLEQFDRVLRIIDRRLDRLPDAAPAVGAGESHPAGPAPSTSPAAGNGRQGWRPEWAASPGLPPVPPASPRTARDRIAAERAEWVSARGRVWPSILGPMVACAGFAAIAGMMLLGAGAFTESDFRLNTTLILLLAYGWGLVLAWTLVGLRRLPSLTEPAEHSAQVPQA